MFPHQYMLHSYYTWIIQVPDRSLAHPFIMSNSVYKILKTSMILLIASFFESKIKISNKLKFNFELNLMKFECNYWWTSKCNTLNNERLKSVHQINDLLRKRFSFYLCWRIYDNRIHSLMDFSNFWVWKDIQQVIIKYTIHLVIISIL